MLDKPSKDVDTSVCAFVEDHMVYCGNLKSRLNGLSERTLSSKDKIDTDTPPSDTADSRDSPEDVFSVAAFPDVLLHKAQLGLGALNEEATKASGGFSQGLSALSVSISNEAERYPFTKDCKEFIQDHSVMFTVSTAGGVTKKDNTAGEEVSERVQTEQESNGMGFCNKADLHAFTTDCGEIVQDHTEMLWACSVGWVSKSKNTTDKEEGPTPAQTKQIEQGPMERELTSGEEIESNELFPDVLKQEEQSQVWGVKIEEDHVQKNDILATVDESNSVNGDNEANDGLQMIDFNIDIEDEGGNKFLLNSAGEAEVLKKLSSALGAQIEKLNVENGKIMQICLRSDTAVNLTEESKGETTRETGSIEDAKELSTKDKLRGQLKKELIIYVNEQQSQELIAKDIPKSRLKRRLRRILNKDRKGVPSNDAESVLDSVCRTMAVTDDGPGDNDSIGSETKTGEATRSLETAGVDCASALADTPAQAYKRADALIASLVGNTAATTEGLPTSAGSPVQDAAKQANKRTSGNLKQRIVDQLGLEEGNALEEFVEVAAPTALLVAVETAARKESRQESDEVTKARELQRKWSDLKKQLAQNKTEVTKEAEEKDEKYHFGQYLTNQLKKYEASDKGPQVTTSTPRQPTRTKLLQEPTQNRKSDEMMRGSLASQLQVLVQKTKEIDESTEKLHYQHYANQRHISFPKKPGTPRTGTFGSNLTTNDQDLAWYLKMSDKLAKSRVDAGPSSAGSRQSCDDDSAISTGTEDELAHLRAKQDRVFAKAQALFRNGY